MRVKPKRRNTNTKIKRLSHFMLHIHSAYLILFVPPILPALGEAIENIYAEAYLLSI